MLLSIIIVSYNTKDLLRDCLDSIDKEGSEINKEVWVVDNASTDGSAEMVEKEFQKVKLIKNRENFGFSRANNQALKKAGGDYLFLLNSDTELKPKALSTLVDFAHQNPQAGIVGAKLLNPDNSSQASVYHLPTFGSAIREYIFDQRGAYEKYSPPTEKPLEVDSIVGAAMLIKREVVEKIGYLDERYFMYFEDLDYCRRARRRGFKVYYLPQVQIIHYHGASGQNSRQTYQYLIKSSKIYHGTANFWLINFVLWVGQKWQKLKRHET